MNAEMKLTDELALMDELALLIEPFLATSPPDVMSAAIQQLFIFHLQCYTFVHMSKESAKGLVHEIYLYNLKQIEAIYADEGFLAHQKDQENIKNLMKEKFNKFTK
jgi:hypothetical protein